MLHCYNLLEAVCNVTEVVLIVLTSAKVEAAAVDPEGENIGSVHTLALALAQAGCCF